MRGEALDHHDQTHHGQNQYPLGVELPDPTMRWWRVRDHQGQDLSLTTGPMTKAGGKTPERIDMLTASAKQKGRRLQQWVATQILERWLSLEPDDVRSTSMGAGGEDIQLSPAARSLLPLSIECKNLQSMAFYKWYDQAVANCPKDCEPIVVAKANHRTPVVIVDAEYFFDHYENRKQKRR